MKKLLKLQSILMLLLFFVAITGCNKDDDDNGGGDNPAQTNYRLKESVSTGGAKESSKDVYSYDSEKLSVIMEYTGSEANWAEYFKTEISYPSDNSFEKLSYNYLNGNWILNGKEVISHNGGQWQTYIDYYYNGSDWEMDEKVVYTYSNGKITKEEGFVYYSGVEENEYKNIYTYAGDVPSTIEKYEWEDGNWESTGKDSLLYSGGKLIAIEMSEIMEGIPVLFKYEFEYSGDLINKIAVKYQYGGMWMDFGAIMLTYDDHGNIIKEEGQGQLTFSVTNTYEEGNSNWELINGNPGDLSFYDMGFSKSFQKINNEVNKIALSVLSQR